MQTSWKRSPQPHSPLANEMWLNGSWATRSTTDEGSNISDTKAFAATTLAFGVGVVELEALVEALLDEIQLGAIQMDQALG